MRRRSEGVAGGHPRLRLGPFPARGHDPPGLSPSVSTGPGRSSSGAQDEQGDVVLDGDDLPEQEVAELLDL